VLKTRRPLLLERQGGAVSVPPPRKVGIGLCLEAGEEKEHGEGSYHLQMYPVPPLPSTYADLDFPSDEMVYLGN